MAQQRILVTGTSGFVGGAIARHLRALGHEVVGTVNSRPGDASDHVVDVRDPKAFDAIPGDFDAVVHAAARLGGERFCSVMRDVNVRGTSNALAFAAARSVRHFVQVSSIAAYGLRCTGEDRTEDTALAGSWPNPLITEYLRSKAAAERLVVGSGLPFTILRMPVVLGAGSSFAAPAMLPLLRTGVAPWYGRRDRRVSVLCVENSGPLVRATLDAGPAGRAYNACDHHLRWDELVERYARALAVPLRWERRSALDVASRMGDPHFSFFVWNGLLGAHFPSDAIEAERPFERLQTLDAAIADEVAAG